MPAPGDRSPLDALSFPGGAMEAQRASDARDRMFARMHLATPGGPMFPSNPTTAPAAPAAPVSVGTLMVASGLGAVMAALDDPLYRRIERALLPYTDIGTAGCTPEHRWRAAEHFRPFHAISALVAEVQPLVKPLAAYTRQELLDELEKRA